MFAELHELTRPMSPTHTMVLTIEYSRAVFLYERRIACRSEAEAEAGVKGLLGGSADDDHYHDYLDAVQLDRTHWRGEADLRQAMRWPRLPFEDED